MYMHIHMYIHAHAYMHVRVCACVRVWCECACVLACKCRHCFMLGKYANLVFLRLPQPHARQSASFPWEWQKQLRVPSPESQISDTLLGSRAKCHQYLYAPCVKWDWSRLFQGSETDRRIGHYIICIKGWEDGERLRQREKWKGGENGER